MTITIPIEVAHFIAGASTSILIDGKRREALSGETLDTVDPGTGKVLSAIAAGRVEDVDLAVAAATRAFENVWRDLNPGARARALFSFATLIDDHAEELAMLESLDNGKPLTESQYIDMAYAAETIRYYAGWATKLTGDVLPVSPMVGEAFAYTRREPLGVVGAIVPWNFPVLLTSWKIGPALAAGCTVVLKPSEMTSLSAIRLAELALEAGVPPGVFNVVTGYGPEAGQALVEHRDVAKITFTGSTETGKRIIQASAATLKQVSLELGGKSPNIIFADADLEAATQGALLGIFMNQGQVCCAGSRALVQAEVHDEMIERLEDAASKITLGHGLADGTDMGPLVSETQRDRVMAFIDGAQRDGACLVTGGVAPGGDLADGYFVQPTIFSGVTDDMRVATEEVFGPVLSVLSFTDDNDAVTRANASRYGLAAGVWTNDLRRAHRVANALEAGTVWVNTYNMLDPAMPFGGYKESGFGRDLGAEALQGYTHTKSVWINLD